MSDINTETLNWLDEHLNAKPIGEDDHTQLFGRPVYRPKSPDIEPRVAALAVATLGSVVDYLKAGIDDFDLETHALHVVSATEVRLLGPEFGYHKQRECRVVATFASQVGDLFDRDLKLERANVALQALFLNTPDCKDLRDVLSAVTGTDTVVRADDGQAQSITVQVGVATKDRKVIPNPVPLAPFRSFPEIVQVESPFVVRVGKQGDEVTVRLIPADGDAWQLEARRRIAAHLAELLAAKDLAHPLIMA